MAVAQFSRLVRTGRGMAAGPRVGVAMKSWVVRISVIVAAAAVIGACAPLIAGYSLQAYQNGTTLKADVAALVEKSTDEYTNHSGEVDTMTTRVNEAYEFSKGESSNALSTAQWKLLLDPAGGLYGGFVTLWRKHGHLSQTEADDKKVQIDRAFDQIICLEANKQKPTKCAAPESLSG